jgi:hypothetical protein
VLQLGQRPRRHRVAWDLFLLYEVGRVWRDDPPVPDFWMHQLLLDDVPTLDATALRCALEQRLPAVTDRLGSGDRVAALERRHAVIRQQSGRAPQGRRV